LRFAENPLLPGEADRHARLHIVLSGMRPGTSVHLDQQSALVSLDTPLDQSALAAGAVSANVDLSQVPLGRHLVPIVIHSTGVGVTDLQPATVFVTISQESAL